MNVTSASTPPRRRATGLATFLLFLTAGVTAAPASSAGSPVIVQASTVARAAAAVRAVGGTVETTLPIVNGVSATVPSAAQAALRAKPSVLAVTPNEQVRLLSTDTTNTSTVKPVFNREIGADLLWAEGINGAGVRVALVDTGVTAQSDLAGRLVQVPDPFRKGQTVDCINFSGESGCGDSYGHGTFMAGLIAGNGASSGGRYTGVAQGAQIVSIKIAGRDGSADVSKVLAAIQWVVSFSKDFNIRVLNLSLGTNSTASYKHDPLNYAVQRAWRAGIVVVVAAGNRGPDKRTISKPADDPLVMTVGAVDDRETPATDDDRLPAFSAKGPTASDGLPKPDVVAPGGRVVSLRSDGSTIDRRVPTSMPAPYRRGSGTSMATAIASGATALMLQAKPDWNPDRVKFAFMSTARKVASRDPDAVGAGLIDVFTATRLAPPGEANKGITTLSDFTGPLEASRGTVYVTSPCRAAEALDPMCGRLHDEQTALADTIFDRKRYSGVWDGSSWYSSQWASAALDGSSWYGSSWYGSSWYGSSWYGSSWYGSEDATFYGNALDGSSWYGAWE